MENSKKTAGEWTNFVKKFREFFSEEEELSNEDKATVNLLKKQSEDNIKETFAGKELGMTSSNKTNNLKSVEYRSIKTEKSVIKNKNKEEKDRSDYTK